MILKEQILELLELQKLDALHTLVNDNSDVITLVLEKQRTLLHYAAERGYLELIQLIIEKRPNLIDLPDALNQTPILWAAANGHVRVVYYLAQMQADLNLTTRSQINKKHNGYAPVHWATERGHQDVVRCLIAHDVDINLRFGSSQSHLIHLASQEGNLELVQLLIAANSDVLTLVNDCGRTAIFFAVVNAQAHVAEYLSRKIAESGFYAILQQFKSVREKYPDTPSFTLLYDSIVQIAETSQPYARQLEQLQQLLGYYELVARITQTDVFFAPDSPENYLVLSLGLYIADQVRRPLHSILYARSLSWPENMDAWYDPIMGGKELPGEHNEFVITTGGEVCQLECLIDTAIRVFSQGHREQRKIWQSNDPRSLNQPISRDILLSLGDRFPVFKQFYHHVLSIPVDTPLSRLLALREGLRDGSKFGNNKKSKGDEYNAGAPANEALVIFSEWWNDITGISYKNNQTLQQMLGQLQTGPTGARNLNEFFAILLRDQSADIKGNAITCLQLRGDELQVAIERNIDILSSFEKQTITQRELLDYKNKILSAFQKGPKNSLSTHDASPRLIVSGEPQQLSYFSYAITHLWSNFSTGKIHDSTLVELANLLTGMSINQRQQLWTHPVDATQLESLHHSWRYLEKKLAANLLLSTYEQEQLEDVDKALLGIIACNYNVLVWVVRYYPFIVFTNKTLADPLIKKSFEITVEKEKWVIRDRFNFAYYIFRKTGKIPNRRALREKLLFDYLDVASRELPVSPMLIAIKKNDIQACQTLLSTNRECVTHIDWETGNSSLAMAAKNGCYSLCLLLAQNGADVTLTNREGKTAEELWPGRFQQNNPFIQLRDDLILLSKQDPNLSEDRQALLWQLLLTQNTTLLTWEFAPNKVLCNFLSHALAYYKLPIVERLTAHQQWSVFAQFKDSDGYTLLHLMAWSNGLTACKYLHTLIDINNIDNCKRRSALYLAAKDGNREVCQFLLNQGADVDLQCSEGYSALSIAAENGHGDICDMLLRNGADLTLKNKQGRSAVELWSAKNPFNVFYQVKLAQKKEQVLARLDSELVQDWTIAGFLPTHQGVINDLFSNLRHAQFDEGDTSSQTADDVLNETIETWVFKNLAIRKNSQRYFFSSGNLSRESIEKIGQDVRAIINPEAGSYAVYQGR